MVVPSLTLIIPCINETKNFDRLNDRLKTVISQLEISCDCIFVGLPEGEPEMQQCVEAAGYTYLKRSPSASYGDAVRTGITHANTTYVGFMDADNSHDPSFLLTAEPTLLNDADLVVGSRYMDGGSTANGFISQFMSYCVNFVFRLVLGTKISDLSNSQKIYRRELIAGGLRCDNFDIIEEMVWRIIKYGREEKIYEFPASFDKRLHGETKREFIPFVKSYLATALRLISLRFVKSR